MHAVHACVAVASTPCVPRLGRRCRATWQWRWPARRRCVRTALRGGCCAWDLHPLPCEPVGE